MSKYLESEGRIVVGTDLSHQATAAVDWAAHRAVAHGRTLLIALVLPEVPIPKRSNLYDAMLSGDYLADLNKRAQRRLGEEVTRLHEVEPEARVETALIHARPSYALAQATKDAELVVIGARGRHAPVGVRVLGGTADAVVTHAHGPVAVVTDRSELTPGGPVVVGVDDAPESLAAIRFAVTEAVATGTSLVALHAWDMAAWLAQTAGAWSIDPQVMGTTLDEMVRDLVAPYIADHPGLEVERRVVPDRPALALVDASRGASLVVVGSRGRGGFTGLLLGSTSKAVLRDAHAPVVVVRADET